MYSLGAVLYELISGELPSPGDTIAEVIESVRDKPVDLPSSRSSRQIPKQLEAICMTCLQKDPDDRHRNMADLVRLLQGGWTA